MALPTDIHMPGYFIYRDINPDLPFDAGAHLLFFPPKDSDELFDALREHFPHVKSHSERIREAVFEFLLEESQSLLTQQPFVPYSVDTTAISPWSTSFASMTSDTSTWSSPEFPDLDTPPYEEPIHSQPCSRQYSTASEMASSGSSPPAIEKMTNVFSLTDSSLPKQRVRRKMTEQEKVEYRKRRVVKACEKCSKRKRKCTHDQQQLGSAAHEREDMSKMKVSPNSRGLAAPASSNALDNSMIANTVAFDNTVDFGLMQPGVDFVDLLDVPMDVGEVDDFASPLFQNITHLNSDGQSDPTLPWNSPEMRAGGLSRHPSTMDESRHAPRYELNELPSANGLDHEPIARSVNSGEASFTTPGQLRTNTSSQLTCSLPLGELGEGSYASMDPRTELFRLRHGISKTLDSINTRSNAESASHAQQGRRTDPIDGLGRVIPCRRSSEGVATLTSVDVHSSTNHRLQVRAQHIAGSVCTSCGDQPSCLHNPSTHQDRLSDHVRRKDHFGRQLNAGLQVLGAAIGLGCLAVLLSLVPNVSLSLLLPVLISPISQASQLPTVSKYASCRARIKGTWHSWWGYRCAMARRSRVA